MVYYEYHHYEGPYSSSIYDLCIDAASDDIAVTRKEKVWMLLNWQ